MTVLRVPENGTIGGTSKDIVTNTLDVRNFADASQDTSVKFRVTNLAYTVADSGGNPRKKRRFDLSGFPRGSTVWAHYRFGGRTLGTVRFGTAKGDCGLVSVKMALLPAKVPNRYLGWEAAVGHQARLQEHEPAAPDDQPPDLPRVPLGTPGRR